MALPACRLACRRPLALVLFLAAAGLYCGADESARDGPTQPDAAFPPLSARTDRASLWEKRRQAAAAARKERARLRAAHYPGDGQRAAAPGVPGAGAGGAAAAWEQRQRRQAVLADRRGENATRTERASLQQQRRDQIAAWRAQRWAERERRLGNRGTDRSDNRAPTLRGRLPSGRHGTPLRRRGIGPRTAGLGWAAAKEASAPLPQEGELASQRTALEASCGVGPARRPPETLAVMGLPNTGTNAVRNFLGASLGGMVVHNGVPGLWKHAVPFQPDMDKALRQACADETMGVVFTVRHPAAWLSSQTSPSHSFGHMCQSSPAPNCLFRTCEGEDGCWKNFPPWHYSFGSLLDLWAAYAAALPAALPAVYVLRYEDFLADPQDALLRVSRHFSLSSDVSPRSALRSGMAALEHSARPWDQQTRGATHPASLSKWRAFSQFWAQVRRRRADPEAEVVCDPAAQAGPLMNARAQPHLPQGEPPPTQQAMLQRYNYTALTLEDAKVAAQLCNRGRSGLRPPVHARRARDTVPPRVVQGASRVGGPLTRRAAVEDGQAAQG